MYPCKAEMTKSYLWPSGDLALSDHGGSGPFCLRFADPSCFDAGFSSPVSSMSRHAWRAEMPRRAVQNAVHVRHPSIMSFFGFAWNRFRNSRTAPAVIRACLTPWTTKAASASLSISRHAEPDMMSGSAFTIAVDEFTAVSFAFAMVASFQSQPPNTQLLGFADENGRQQGKCLVKERSGTQRSRLFGFNSMVSKAPLRDPSPVCSGATWRFPYQQRSSRSARHPKIEQETKNAVTKRKIDRGGSRGNEQTRVKRSGDRRAVLHGGGSRRDSQGQHRQDHEDVRE